MKETVLAWGRRVGPVRMAFLASLLLSAIATWNSPVLNRDGMLYLEMAQSLLDHGLAPMLREDRSWLFVLALPGATALASLATGLGVEAAARVVNALFMAGSCALLVAITRRRLPGAAWVACLVVLAMPAYNDYRNQVLREYGFWFFSLLALRLALRWEDAAWRWREALACQLAVACAALFRLEAVAFFPALFAWQAFDASKEERLRRMLRISLLPLAAGFLLALLLATGLADIPYRVLYYLDAANPLRKLQAFRDLGEGLADQVLKNRFVRQEAGYVLFVGLLSMIPVKFVKLSGVLALPMLYGLFARWRDTAAARWAPLAWAFVAYLVVLAAFVTHNHFLIGRHVGMLCMLAVPLTAAGLHLMLQRWERWRAPMLALALLTLMANVVSLTPANTQIVEAGRWISANVPESARQRVYADNPRVGYYGGLGYLRIGRLLKELPTPADAAASNRFDVFALEVPRKDGSGVENWLASNGYRVVERFANRAGDAVVIALPPAAQPSPSTAERSRSNTGSRE